MNAVRAGTISLSLEFPEHEEGFEPTAPFIEVNTLKLVDLAVDAGAPDSLIHALHASGQSVDFSALLSSSIEDWAEADRPAAAAAIADWLEALATELRRPNSFSSLDKKPRRDVNLR